ncbi:hypothetical protein JCM3770_004593 [Rhodotorula araucariae]
MPPTTVAILATAAAAHQPGKAPVLFNTLPAGLTAFGQSAKLYFLTNKITEDALKIEFVAAGLQLFPELHNWYLSYADALETKMYNSFLVKRQRRALPCDFVWNEKDCVRTLKQGNTDFEDWLDEARTAPLSLMEKILPTREFIESLLYSVDKELSAVLGSTLRRATSGAEIAARQRGNAAQVKSLSKRTAGLTVSSSSGKSGTSKTVTTTATTSSTDASPRLPPLTARKRDWLAANDGCFKCRKPNAGHQSLQCQTWAPAGHVVPMPTGWTQDAVTVTSTSTGSKMPRVGVAAIGLSSNQDEVELPESLAYGTDSDNEWLPTLVEQIDGLDKEGRGGLAAELAQVCAVRLHEQVGDDQKELEDLAVRAKKLLTEFDNLFPSTLPLLTANFLAKCTTRHRIQLVDDKKIHNQGRFAIPHKWRESWKRMLGKHLVLRPLTWPYASVAFVVPKRDPTADPRWVNDYLSINANTVKDQTRLPFPDVVLANAARAKAWGKIDMTNAFFQTPMLAENIEKTAIKTPWGLFEWTVMPQGLCNALATHQARVKEAEALRHLIGVCCEAFIDDIIIIYSNTLEEQGKNCRAVLSALHEAGLYCSAKKTDLFTTRAEFLGHVISHAGGTRGGPLEVEKILNWPRPKTVTRVRGFLGVVQYLRKLIPSLAERIAALTPLTRKGLTSIEAMWNAREEKVFDCLERIVTSLPVLKPLDQDSEVPIWLMTDASKVGIGAVLPQGQDWKTASPCRFYSRQCIAAEKIYPTHKQELLAIIAALKAWRIDLLGMHFRVLTDHDTLKHFGTQPTLSKRQAHWTEALANSATVT